MEAFRMPTRVAPAGPRNEADESTVSPLIHIHVFEAADDIRAHQRQPLSRGCSECQLSSKLLLDSAALRWLFACILCMRVWQCSSLSACRAGSVGVLAVRKHTGDGAGVVIGCLRAR